MRTRICRSHKFHSTASTGSSNGSDASDSSDSTWKTIFSTLENDSTSLDRQEIRNLKPSDTLPPLIGNRRQLSNKKTNITAQESEIFEDILNLLFQHSPNQHQSIDKRKLPKRPRLKQSDTDLLLDKSREELLSCSNPVELFNWSKLNVLDVDPTSPTLPYLLTDLMVVFRDTYNNPHLSLSIFKYVKNRGVYQYVLGCTTPAYNELIATKWASFADINGVRDILEEMLTNGVKRDARTEQLVEDIRNDVMKQHNNDIDEQLAATLLRMEYTSSKPLKPSEKSSSRYVMTQDGATAKAVQWKEREQALEKAYIATRDTENLLKLKNSLEKSIEHIDSHLNAPPEKVQKSTLTNSLESEQDRTAQIDSLEKELELISKRLASLEAGSRHI
ncbi:hypothetical protein E3P77_01554 [Wallemia ichthyophaga]|nr:hypothetical protein E3P77_01554 [Wallemia ichthyophaga]